LTGVGYQREGRKVTEAMARIAAPSAIYCERRKITKAKLQNIGRRGRRATLPNRWRITCFVSSTCREKKPEKHVTMRNGSGHTRVLRLSPGETVETGKRRKK